MKRVKLSDVAAAAGVSSATVSLVLSENADGRVSEGVEKRVLAAAKKLRYSPNLVARSLRTQKSKTIGLISDTVATTNFAGQMLAGAEEMAWKRGWLLIFVDTSADSQNEERAIKALLQRNVEGFIYASMFHRKLDYPLQLKNQPTIFLHCSLNSPDTHSSVVPDEYASASLAMDFLIKNGHREIGWIGITNPTVGGRERSRAYIDAMKKLKVKDYKSLMFNTFESYANDGYVGAMKLLQGLRRPTALFCFSDRMAMGAYRAANEIGLRIPQDVSIMGFDNQPHIAEALWPPLSTMQLPHYEMGTWAAQRLIDVLENQDSESVLCEQKVITCKLIERDSVAPHHPMKG